MKYTSYIYGPLWTHRNCPTPLSFRMLCILHLVKSVYVVKLVNVYRYLQGYTYRGESE